MARHSFLFSATLAILAGAVPLGGCGFLTGAEDLIIDETGGAGGAEPTAGTGAGNTGTGNTGAGDPGSGGAGAGNPGTGGSGAGTTTGSNCPPCGANQYCEASTATCQCSPGFVLSNGSCEPAPPGDPSTRTADEVCAKWQEGHVVTTADPLDASGAECDAGTLKQGAINDTLARMNMFRWLAGLGPTTDSASQNAGAQLCANLESWWDFSNPNSPHSPPAGVKCYTSDGASFAGMSNIAWGSGHPAQAIDQFMEDNGNETTMGHRRWIMNPPLSDVGIGYWEGGGPYGNAECLRVFGGGGNGPNPPWTGVPNQGFVPVTVAQWTWTFHGSLGGIAGAQVSMLLVDDNTPLAVKMLPLSQGYAQETTSWIPQGWQVEAGKTYRVTVSGVAGGDVTYDVKPITCN